MNRRMVMCIVGAMLLFGCKGEESSDEGLTILSWRSGGGVTATYAHHGAQVRLEAVQSTDEGDPVVSARITTSAGRTIAAISSGDPPAEWAVEPDGMSPSTSELEGAKLGAKELTLAGLDEPVRDSFQALFSSLDEIGTVSAGASTSAVPLVAPAVTYAWVYSYTDNNGCNSCQLSCGATCNASNEGKTMKCRVAGTNNNDDVYICKASGVADQWRQVVDMYKKQNKKIWTGEMVYWSQTRTRRQKSTDGGSTWTTTATWEYTNHYGGNLRTEGVAAYKTCAGPKLSSETGLFTISSSPLCSSGYVLDSGLKCQCSKHNANDDTEYQMAQVMANTRFGDQHFRCGDSNSDSSPPNDCSVRDGWTQ